MTRHLCISVTLIDPLFHGKSDGDEPEWPPSPMRLFQALVAGSLCGCRSTEWSSAKEEAYRWLERRTPPMIIAPPGRRATAYTLFVPNNDADKRFERQDRLTSKIVRPCRLISKETDAGNGLTMRYLWAIQEDEWAESRPHTEVLCREARHLIALGWGIDHAVAEGRVLADDTAAALVGRRWRAWRIRRSGQKQSRIPIDGSLQDLVMVHTSFVNRINGKRFAPPQKLRRFDAVAYLPVSTFPPRPHVAFELPKGMAFRQEKAVVVAAMLRSLACRCAKDDSHLFPGGSETYVAGHGPRTEDGRLADQRWPRFSYLPLPSIGHEHADGMIRRLLVAEPFGGDGDHAWWAQQRLRNEVLQDKQGDARGVLLDLWRPSSSRLVGRYVRGSQEWFSVTPVVLPGLDDGKQPKAERLFLKAAAQSQIPIGAIEEVILRKAPFWPGAAHPRHYFVPEYLRGFARWHAMVRFREPVPGPLAIGAGRHVGMGLMAGSDDT